MSTSPHLLSFISLSVSLSLYVTSSILIDPPTIYQSSHVFPQVLCGAGQAWGEIGPILFEQHFIKLALFDIYIGAFEGLKQHEAITHMTKSIATEIAKAFIFLPPILLFCRRCSLHFN